MSASTDKLAGAANQAAGSVKEAVGKTVGNKKLEAEGAAQKVKGKVQETVGDAKSKVKGVIDRF